MKNKTLNIKILALAVGFCLLPFASALPADADDIEIAGGIVNGEIGGTAWDASVSGSKAKFSEYRDMTEHGGIFGNIRLNYAQDGYWATFKSTDMGYDTQRYDLSGGSYGNFKVDAFYNEIVHNITFGAITPYSNPGSYSLTYPGTAISNNPATWTGFDYSIKRKQAGGDIKVDLLKPFYLDFSVMNEHREGILPVGAGTGMVSPGAFIELPEPINYNTNNFTGEIGYATRPLTASIDFTFSDFGNEREVLDYESILSHTGQTDSTTLPPDNDYFRLGFKANMQLPFNSRFNVNLSDARSESQFDLLQSYLLTGTKEVSLVTPPNSLSSLTFDGKRDFSNYDFVLTSNPVSFLDGRVFYKYYDTEDKSPTVTAVDTNNTTTASSPGFVFTNPLFSYKTTSLGVNLDFKLPDRFHFVTGYTLVETDRSREDVPEDTDNVYKFELRWNGVDFMTPRVSYERLQRDAQGPEASALTDNFGIAEWLGRFDAETQTRDTYKATLDFFPMDNLDFGTSFEYIRKYYPVDILGMRTQDTTSLDLYGQYKIGKIAMVSAYFDLESMLTDSYFRSFQSAPNNVVDPYAPQNSKNYNWSMDQKDDTYEAGAAAEVYLVPKKLTFTLRYDSVNSDGSEGLTIFDPAALTALNPSANNSNIGIPDVDSYRENAITAQLRYVIKKSFVVAAAFSYEEYKYNDVSLDGYEYYFTNSSGTTQYYLSGAYANPSYVARVFFLTASYRF